MFLHGICKDKLTALLKHYRLNGVSPRVHKLTKKLPKNALTFDETKYVVTFIVDYSETHTMSLPGRVHGYARDDLKLLPSNCSKKMVYENYVDACKPVNARACSLVLFRHLWRQLVPFVVVLRPKTDLCWFCQKNVTMISRATNVSEEVKDEAFLKAQDHLATAKTEREFYHSVCSQAKHDAEGVKQLVKKQPVTFEGLGHYSMDFAQQVHFPSNPLQPGPIYFKTPRMCHFWNNV